MEQKRLISHVLSPEALERTIQKMHERIRSQGDKPYASVEYQLGLLTELSQFDFGRYLLQNQGINGYWTHYMLTHPWFGRKTGKNNQGEPLTQLESFLLNRAPTMLATQQRFQIFLKENQKQVQNDARLACIPCGLLGELLYLDYQQVERIQLLGVDYDPHTLNEAKNLAKQQDLLKFVKLIEQDAWKLNFEAVFDLISSNGLSIYEPDDNNVIALYREFYKALKPGGKLVTSFLTPPPLLASNCEWNMSTINQDDLLMQKIIFADILEVKWQCYRSSEQATNQLISAGFNEIQIIYDEANLFPTVVAHKN